MILNNIKLRFWPHILFIKGSAYSNVFTTLLNKTIYGSSIRLNLYELNIMSSCMNNDY